MWISTMLSRRCCGGPVLVLMLLCLGVSVLFFYRSAWVPGSVFLVAGLLALGTCLLMGRNRCRSRHVH